MKGFVLGVLVAALAFGGYLYYEGRLGDAARSADPVVSAPDAGEPGKKRRKRKRGAARVAKARGADPGTTGEEVALEPEPEPLRLSAADLKIVGQGDDLSRPDVLRVDLTKEGGLPELSQDDIDARFRAEEESILECIARARPDEETYVPGRVTVKFRIQRAGTVRGVRVEAPAILQKGGLYSCVKGVVMGLRFPESGSSQVVTYPFSLS
jgi:hypothetical protein